MQQSPPLHGTNMTETLTQEQVQRTHDRRRRPVGPHYKWVALTNTTLGSLMATIDASIVLIAFPAIFKGIGINPLAPGESSYFLWLLLGYMVVTATLLVTFGRISDMCGRVRLYNLGCLIFAIASTLLALTPSAGNTGALELIIFRLIQGIGSGFLLSNSAAILTDAFPVDQRGRALGINQIAGIAGSFIGLIVGGILAAINWRLVFLVIVLLAAFVWIELHVDDPMFRLDLFKIRMFAAGNTAGFLSALGRGGLQFMLIIWLQGIWLPLHGYRFE